MKIVVDRTKCTGLGICESIAPDVFEVDENGDLVILEEQVTENGRAEVEQAVEGCPTFALRIEQ
ncbi:ferredoxin [Nocardia carnea]|uniref:ferredoxin n=1 Tax=Nocardia carnea TaxID=37328 RepID=UPI002454944E|nr:ferredoxin [Nocardia carnea]